jgi:hypothetical protein
MKILLPSQQKAIGLLEVLEKMENESSLPDPKRDKLAHHAENWGSRRTLYYLREFIDAEGPEFYRGELEQNEILAEEAIRNLANDTESLNEAYSIIISYADQIPEPKAITRLDSSKKIPTIVDNKLDIIKPIPMLWTWNKASVLLIPFELAFCPSTARLLKVIEHAETICPHELSTTIIYKLKPIRSKKESVIAEDIWAHCPKKDALESPSWLLSHGMITEDILHCLELIKDEDTPIEITA